MTLLEVMVSTALVGVIMIALMFLLFQTGLFNTRVSQDNETIQGVADTVQQFSSVISNATRIKTCYCGGTTSSRAACAWDGLNNPWRDPVMNNGATSPVVLLKGEYEAFDGTQTPGITAGSMAALTTGNISLGGLTCNGTSSNLASSLLRGCKVDFELDYTAPTKMSTSPSLAGMVKLKMGTTKSVQIGAATSSGAHGLGVTQLSCGFNWGAAGTSGTDFVLNMRLMARQNIVNDVTNPNYVTWYPNDPSDTHSNYAKAMVRDVQLKFAMRNLETRGVYFWKPEAVKRCLKNTAASGPAQCCSHAWDGTNCLMYCVPAGTAATAATACCSGSLNGGNCK